MGVSAQLTMEKGYHYLFVALLALSLFEHGHSQCRRPPFWLFSLPEDIQPIFAGLTGKHYWASYCN